MTPANFFHKTAIASIVIGLAGCSTLGGGGAGRSAQHVPMTNQELAQAQSRSQTLAESGVDYLVKGDLVKAQQVFNTALKFDIKSVPLHFFNALTYQIRHERGDQEAFELAKAGYKTALKLDPSLDIAHMQLGHLYMSVNNYALAQKSFANAIDLSPLKIEEPLYYMAKASLMAGDTPSSAWAVKRLEDLKWRDARLVRLKAFQAATARHPDTARKMLTDYLEVEKNPDEQRYVKARLSQLIAINARESQLGAPTLVAAASQSDADADESSDTGSTSEGAALSFEGKPAWFTCDENPRLTKGESDPLVTPTELEPGDESYVTTALPRPCNGEAPPTAIIEVTMIRTEEKDTQAYGTNLLEGLKVSATGLTKAAGELEGGFSSGASKVFYNEGTVADDLLGGMLTYNLNIANSLYEKNEVVARPTLAAIDRLPSVFFSGSNYSVQVGNSTVGYSLDDKQVGISLSVTPTFVNDESLLLSIRAARSFMEPTVMHELNPIKLTQTRNTVSANALLNYGETFILNGLVEREKDVEQSGTPLMQDIPILQFFFKESIKVDYNRQVLTLVTVRRLINNDDALAKARNKKGLVSMHKLSSQIDHFIELQNSHPVLDEVLSSLVKDNGLYRRLKSRDLIQESTSHLNALQLLIKDAQELFYY